MRKLKLFLGIILSGTVSLITVLGAEVGNRKMVWAHNTPWFYPANNPGYPVNYYNFPLQESKVTENLIASLREEVRIAQENGLDGFFLDFGGDPHEGIPHWSFRLPDYLKAASGTDFQIGLCIDTKISADYWIKWLKKLLSANGNHPNYPKVGHKYVVCTYQFLHGEKARSRSWRREDWRKLHAAMNEAGYPIYLIGNVAPTPNTDLNLKQLQETLDIYDCLYMFDSPAHAAKAPEYNNRLLAAFCQTNNKRFMPTLHPGYLGTWSRNENDFYNPFRCFDSLYRTFADAKKHKPEWIHITTWNDLNETTGLNECLFTFGATHTLKFYSKDLKGTPLLVKKPDVLVSYLHEILPGEVLRLEALSMPTSLQDDITISGILRDIDGRTVYKLPAKKLSPGCYARTDWLVPTHRLAATPVLQPEFTVNSGKYRVTRKSIPIYLVSSWLQNPVTVNVPLNRMTADIPHALKLAQQGNRLDATLTFDSPDELKRIMLFRNDRPVGVFAPELAENEMLLNVILFSMPKPVRITFENGHLLHAFREGTQKGAKWQNTIFFDYGKDFFQAADSSSGLMAMTLAGTQELKLIVTNEQGKETVVPAEKLIREQRFVNQDLGLSTSAAGTVFLDEALKMKQGELKFSMFAANPQPTDNFYLRFETLDGRYFFTQPLYPFATNQTVNRSILVTRETLETSKGGNAPAFRGEPDSLTSQKDCPVSKNFVVKTPVSVLSARGAVWDFDGIDEIIIDRYGDRDFRVNAQMLVDDNHGGRALKLDGTSRVTLPSRLWPLSGFGTTELSIKPDMIGGQPQTIVYKGGWYDGLNLNLLPDGKIEVIRCYIADSYSEKDIRMQTVRSKNSVKANEWSKIRIEADHSTLKLFINGKQENSVKQAPFRSHGNGRVILGGAMPGCIPYKGLIDNLSLHGL